MRSRHAIAAVAIGALVALAGCSATSASGTSPSTASGGAGPSSSSSAAPSTSAPATTVPSATVLSSAEQADLKLLHEQERAGLDAFSVFAARFPSQPVFANLTSSQKIQLTTVTAMLVRYGLGDPSTGLAAGTYAVPAVQQLYDATVAAGTSADHALDAVEHFEEQNLASLQAARTHTTRADLTLMYTNLELASHAHIAACTVALQHAASRA